MFGLRSLQRILLYLDWCCKHLSRGRSVWDVEEPGDCSWLWRKSIHKDISLYEGYLIFNILAHVWVVGHNQSYDSFVAMYGSFSVGCVYIDVFRQLSLIPNRVEVCKIQCFKLFQSAIYFSCWPQNCLAWILEKSNFWMHWSGALWFFWGINALWIIYLPFCIEFLNIFRILLGLLGN